MSPEEAPRLNPTIPATQASIESDLNIYGCAFVVTIDGEDWMVHPNMIRLYTENEDNE